MKKAFSLNGLIHGNVCKLGVVVVDFLQEILKSSHTTCGKRANQAFHREPCVCLCRLICGTAREYVCVYECADIWQSWTCSYTGCEWPEGSRPTREWARQLAKTLLPSQLSLVVWPCGWDTASCVQTLEKPWMSWALNPICGIKIKRFLYVFKGIHAPRPSFALVFVPASHSLWMLGMLLCCELVFDVSPSSGQKHNCTPFTRQAGNAAQVRPVRSVSSF